MHVMKTRKVLYIVSNIFSRHIAASVDTFYRRSQIACSSHPPRRNSPNKMG